MYSPCYLFTYLSIDLFIYWLRAAACGILDPGPGIEPMPSAVEAYNPTHWPASDFLDYINMSERNSSCVIFSPLSFSSKNLFSSSLYNLTSYASMTTLHNKYQKIYAIYN